MEYLFVLSGAFSTLFFSLLIANKEQRNQNKYLAGIFLLLVFSSFYIFFYYKSNETYYYPGFSELNYAIPMLYGVLLWFYTRALTKVNYDFKKQDLVHFLPFTVFLVYLIIPLIIGTPSPHNDAYGYPWVKLLVTPFYLIAVLVLLTKHRKRLLQHYSYVEDMKHNWLGWITIGALALWVMASIGYVNKLLHPSRVDTLGDYYVLSFAAIYMFALGFIGFSQTDIFRFGKEGKKQDLVDMESDEPALTTVPQAQGDAHEESFGHLLDIMESKKPHLDPQLTLSKLSNISGIPNYKLSAVINQQAQKNFYDFVNGYRVNEVKKKLDEGEFSEYSMLGIASECGFNSKASFNRIFKKTTSMTPSQYLQSLGASH